MWLWVRTLTGHVLDIFAGGSVTVLNSWPFKLYSLWPFDHHVIALYELSITAGYNISISCLVCIVSKCSTHTGGNRLPKK